MKEPDKVAHLPAPLPVAAAIVRAQSAADVRDHVNLIQSVMQAVMKKDVHYGEIPGTKKPTLYKPGAEVLAATFRIAVSYRTEDLSTPDCVRYRVTAVGTHQTSGIVMGEGVGECSSNEEKYKWRRAICDEEFDATPETRRRIKFGKYQGNIEKTKQVRAEPADVANTILKMGAKRAQVAMTLNVTAASDCFAQDIEDLPEHLREEDEPARVMMSDEHRAAIRATCEQIDADAPVPGKALLDRVLKSYKAKTLADIPDSEYDSIIKRLELSAKK